MTKQERSQAFAARVAFDDVHERGTPWLGANFQGPITLACGRRTLDDITAPSNINTIGSPGCLCSSESKGARRKLVAPAPHFRTMQAGPEGSPFDL